MTKLFATYLFKRSRLDVFEGRETGSQGMKRQRTLRILVAVVLIAVIAGCETVRSSGPAALAGQSANSLGTVWTINPDGTFHVTATKPKAQIWGTLLFPVTS